MSKLYNVSFDFFLGQPGMGKTSSLAMLALKWVNAKGKFIHIIHVDPKDKPMVRSQIYNGLIGQSQHLFYEAFTVNDMSVLEISQL